MQPRKQVLVHRSCRWCGSHPRQHELDQARQGKGLPCLEDLGHGTGSGWFIWGVGWCYLVNSHDLSLFVVPPREPCVILYRWSRWRSRRLTWFLELSLPRTKCSRYRQRRSNHNFYVFFFFLFWYGTVFFCDVWSYSFLSVDHFFGGGVRTAVTIFVYFVVFLFVISWFVVYVMIFVFLFCFVLSVCFVQLSWLFRSLFVDLVIIV